MCMIYNWITQPRWSLAVGLPCWIRTTCRLWWTAAQTKNSGCNTRMKRRCCIKVATVSQCQKLGKERTKKSSLKLLCNLLLYSILQNLAPKNVFFSQFLKGWEHWLHNKIFCLGFFDDQSPNTYHHHDNFGIRTLDLGLFDMTSSRPDPLPSM